MSLRVSPSTGRRHLACDSAGCGCRFRMRRPGETVVELRLRASVRGWTRVGRREFCPGHGAPIGLAWLRAQLRVVQRRSARRAT